MLLRIQSISIFLATLLKYLCHNKVRECRQDMFGCLTPHNVRAQKNFSQWQLITIRDITITLPNTFQTWKQNAFCALNCENNNLDSHNRWIKYWSSSHQGSYVWWQTRKNLIPHNFWLWWWPFHLSSRLDHHLWSLG